MRAQRHQKIRVHSTSFQVQSDASMCEDVYVDTDGWGSGPEVLPAVTTPHKARPLNNDTCNLSASGCRCNSLDVAGQGRVDLHTPRAYHDEVKEFLYSKAQVAYHGPIRCLQMLQASYAVVFLSYILCACYPLQCTICVIICRACECVFVQHCEAASSQVVV